MTAPVSIAIEDLLLSERTFSLIGTELRLHGAILHVREHGGRIGQRVRKRSIAERDNATFVEIELEDHNRAVFKTLLLVEGYWETIRQEAGEENAGQVDSQLAIAEIEARLRNAPSLAILHRQAGGRPGTPTPAAGHTSGTLLEVLPPSKQPRVGPWQPVHSRHLPGNIPQTPAGEQGPLTPTPVPPAAKLPALPLPAIHPAVQPGMGESGGRSAGPEVSADSGSDGIPTEIFREWNPEEAKPAGDGGTEPPEAKEEPTRQES